MSMPPWSSSAKSNKKVIIECKNKKAVDALYYALSFGMFPILNEKDISVMSSSTRRDMHLNGSCYIRLVCHTNFDHLKRLINYDTIKEVI